MEPFDCLKSDEIFAKVGVVSLMGDLQLERSLKIKGFRIPECINFACIFNYIF